MKRHIFEAAHLQAFTNSLFVAAGTPQHIADNVAEILIKANLAGHDSHGVLRIPSYLTGIEGGGIRPDAEPDVLRETDNTLHIDGGNGFGHYTSRYAVRRAIEKAKTARTCFATLTRTGHIGRVGGIRARSRGIRVYWNRHRRWRFKRGRRYSPVRWCSRCAWHEPDRYRCTDG